MNIKEFLKVNRLHISIILLGTILLLIPAFHSNIWFDESYSVAIVNHSFSQIWTIGGNDVHPILYYWMLKVVNLIFGENIIIYRIFSVLGISILSVIGLTHVKKDFGKNIGLLFSFLSLFLPVMLNYALEIRMYSWTILFVTLMMIYLNRFIKTKSFKNLILFGIFSLVSSYMHYYALVCAGIINLFLIIYIIRKRKEFEKSIIIKFVITELSQIILYLPWLVNFIGQLKRVGGGFWIKLEFPQILIDIVNFQFKGNLNETIAIIFSVILYIYIAYIIVKKLKKKEEIKYGIIPMLVYGTVILVVSIASIVSPILYARYLFTITGLLIFSISYFIGKENNKYLICIICTIIVIMSVINNISNIKENYDSSNEGAIKYIKENLSDNDIIIYSNINNGGVIAASIKENKQYFLNLENWTIEEAYKAYEPQMNIAYSIDESIKDVKGKICIIDTGEMDLYNKFENKEKYNAKIKKFQQQYKNYTYNIIILEKI